MRATVHLTPIEDAFIRAIGCGEPPTTAIRTAGLSQGMASHVLARPHVASAVRELALRLNRVVSWLDNPKPRRVRS